MVREIHNSAQQCAGRPHVISQTLQQASLLFKKCMLIDEDDFSKVTSTQAGPAALGGYVASLGSFVGAMTLAKNEPLRTGHLDLKQILLESCPVKNKRLAILFVCRILKETEASRVFNLRNPWIGSLLQSLREMPAGGGSDA
jgi:hypothetical protein